MKKMYLLCLSLSLFAAAQSNAMDLDPDLKSNSRDDEKSNPRIGFELNSPDSSHSTKGNSGSEKQSKIGESKEGVTTGGDGKPSNNEVHEESKEWGRGSLDEIEQSVAWDRTIYSQNTVTGSEMSTPLGPLYPFVPLIQKG
jgi:hypothetical protein